MVPYPRDRWLADGITAPSLPPGDEVPLDVAIVYTGYLTGEIKLFDTIQLTTENGKLDVRLVVVGAVAENKDLLYVLDPASGEILQFDLVDNDIQGVNSDYRSFVEFLYRFAVFVEQDEGKQGRAERAEALKATLRGIDPNAFDDEAWWPMVFAQLAS
ncbi:SUKH-4 family immunity protein [Glycomyces sp. NRRL B-16210]|uniref:SUKH-4 family immunity protein n=1 Tax=Glycomyces sp. NRRL B-16210 TaxID=1463821 RepID=UPI0004C17B12|nr:SUKH-4 family immunity protein [Glycomyces sp. NRRL B-16210]